jgi:hypothetical protein
MADILDQADEAQEAFMRSALSHVPPPTTPPGIGLCINCGVAVEGDARWCDDECRDDWQKYGK